VFLLYYEALTNLQIVITAALCTLIWIVQLLHYPNFAFYSAEHFSTAMRFHQHRISWLTIPLMISELLLVIGLLLERVAFFNILAFTLVIMIWLTTFLVQVPIHQKLLAGKNDELISRLVQTNWIRTIAWTMKLALVSLI
jgi:hypothetical protein